MQKNKLLRAAAIPAVAMAVVGLGAPAALAQTDLVYHVTAGSAPANQSVDYHAVTTGDTPQIHFVDQTAGVELTCDSGTAAGSVTPGDYSPGDPIATITSTTWTNCVGPLGLQFTVTGNGTWNLVPDANGTDADGKTGGSIENVNADVADTNGGCSFTVTGSVGGSYANGPSSGTLDLPGDTPGLTLSNVNGALCDLAGIANNDVATFQAKYLVNADDPANDPIQVTSTN